MMPESKSSRGNLIRVGKPAQVRGPKPSLSTDHIARAAIRLADAEGLASLTMQRLAREVGMTTMALYRYFPGKAEVIELMIDSAAALPRLFGKPSSPWIKRLKGWAQRCLAIYQDHPWFLEATTARRTPMGPNELSWMEAALAILAESGIGLKDRHRAFLTILGHVRGHATFQQIRRSGGSREEWTNQLTQFLQPEANRYPNLLDGLRLGAFGESTDAAFDFGLDCILEGINVRVCRQTK